MVDQVPQQPFSCSDHDRLYGGAGDDRLFGNWGDDILEGEAGSDILRGGAGHDILLGGSGTDFLYGEDGDDTLTAYGNTLREYDHMAGGGGNDVFVLGDTNTVFYQSSGYATLEDFSAFFGQGDKNSAPWLLRSVQHQLGNREGTSCHGYIHQLLRGSDCGGQGPYQRQLPVRRRICVKPFLGDEITIAKARYSIGQSACGVLPHLPV